MRVRYVSKVGTPERVAEVINKLNANWYDMVNLTMSLTAKEWDCIAPMLTIGSEKLVRLNERRDQELG